MHQQNMVRRIRRIYIQASELRAIAKWYSDSAHHREYPQFERLWQLSRTVRNRHWPDRIDDCELLSVFYETAKCVLDKFDPDRPPRSGVSQRRTIGNRFTWYFARQLRRYLDHHYRANRPRKRIAKWLRSRPAWQAKKEQIRTALAEISAFDYLLIQRKYGLDCTDAEIAVELGFTDRFAVKRAIRKILKQLAKAIDAMEGGSDFEDQYVLTALDRAWANDLVDGLAG